MDYTLTMVHLFERVFEGKGVCLVRSTSQPALAPFEQLHYSFYKNQIINKIRNSLLILESNVLKLFLLQE